jgi:hypothetical protein
MSKPLSQLSSLIALFFAVAIISSGQETKPSAPAQTLSIPADSPRWALEGQASVTDYQGRKSL